MIKCFLCDGRGGGLFKVKLLSQSIQLAIFRNYQDHFVGICPQCNGTGKIAGNVRHAAPITPREETDE